MESNSESGHIKVLGSRQVGSGESCAMLGVLESWPRRIRQEHLGEIFGLEFFTACERDICSFRFEQKGRMYDSIGKAWLFVLILGGYGSG